MQDYKNAGIRLTNMDHFIEVLKAGWVRRILDEQNKGICKEFYLKKLTLLGEINIRK